MNAVPADYPYDGSDTSDLRWREQIELSLGRVLERHDKLPSVIEDRVAAGIAAGIREIANDDETMRIIAAKLSSSILVTGGQRASEWIGNRILTAAMLAITGFGVAWLVKNGKI